MRRGLVIFVGTQAARTCSTASGSKSISSTPRRLNFYTNRRIELSSYGRIGRSEIMNGPQPPVVGKKHFFSWALRRPPPQISALSRSYAVAQPIPEELDMERDKEAGMEEVVEDCRVQHGELWNEDVKIHYVECGDKNGELVVLIHGFPNFWYVWKRQFLALAESGYHVVAPDLRGYNSSSKPKGIQHYGRCGVVSDMVRIIDGLGGGKPSTVVGHDWGGFVTWALVEDFPDKVKAIFVNVPHATVFSEAVRSNFRQMRRSCFKTLRASFGNTKDQPEDIDRSWP
ncbi:uncharacterized protein [Physcomitrium patens]|nr:uncharacterized protein LOC112278337 isoform X2 [Physcomitrium patens]XP_024367428.1 uncharacterized protein LOC112278337 isoform X2 [Physcomitrium patens]XP_024367429.1 uncharacterized protein LOC112278337 isoform X2 [Physcomitrium patens]|eukprot:XP_024367427.1 uncharacterized protein LOC112278337 isoform X2 [Physcomitrella patens]